MSAVTIPVMAKARIGHFAEAQILEAIGVDMIDESEGRSSLHMSQGSHQAIAYPRFCSIKLLGIFLLFPGWDGSPSQGYPQH